MDKNKIYQEKNDFEITCRTARFTSDIRHYHWHEKLELCQLINRGARFMIEGIIYTAEAGDIVAISEKIIHRFLIDGDGTDIRILQFKPKLLLKLHQNPMPLVPIIKKSEMLAIDGLYDKINLLFELAEEENSAHPDGSNAYFEGIAASLYFLLERHFKSETATDDGRERGEFYKISEYVNNNYKSDITVESIAEKMYISRGRASLIFKKYAGISIGEYVNSLRIRNANELMRGGKTVSEAALESGFQSIRTFNNTYRAVMGKTPSKYLRSESDE